MSLYGKSDTNQGSAIGKLMPASGLPIWMLALAGYFSIATLTNNIPFLMHWIGNGLHNANDIGFFIGRVTGLFSVVFLWLFVFRRNVFYLSYLVLAALVDLTLMVALEIGKFEHLSSYFYWFRGLDSVPLEILGGVVGWENVGDSVLLFAKIGGPVISVAFCALLFYFHRFRHSKKAQPI